MPPAYYYSAEKGELEEILVGALPLGSLPGAMHMEQEISFKSSGDILVMMSDGLPEAENSEDEMVGYDRTLDTIKSLSDKSAVEIKDGLVELCNNWLGDDAELKDDMTFVIIKRNSLPLINFNILITKFCPCMINTCKFFRRIMDDFVRL